MSLRVYNDIEQGSELWIEARCGILTASQIGGLLTAGGKLAQNDTSRALTEKLVAERLTSAVDFVHPSFDMQRGSLDEAYARDFYAEQFERAVEQIGFAVREINGHKLGASPDGLLAGSGGLELKSRRPKTQVRTILADSVPPENLPQIHCCMLVLDREWWDYVSYAGHYPLYVRRVYRDAAWDQLLISALESFEANAAEMIADYRERTQGLPVAPFIDNFADSEIAI